jgi:hypothetical protein
MADFVLLIDAIQLDSTYIVTCMGDYKRVSDW